MAHWPNLVHGAFSSGPHGHVNNKKGCKFSRLSMRDADEFHYIIFFQLNTIKTGC